MSFALLRAVGERRKVIPIGIKKGVHKPTIHCVKIDLRRREYLVKGK